MTEKLIFDILLILFGMSVAYTFGWLEGRDRLRRERGDRRGS